MKTLSEISYKWENKTWAKEQLRKHLFEVGYLLEKEDPHFEAELADLAIIANFLADPKMIEKRLKKFEEKANVESNPWDDYASWYVTQMNKPSTKPDLPPMTEFECLNRNK